MGVFRQLGQLFWKNFVLRKRQPHILLLEVVWPILVFAIVVIVRQGTQPSQRETCSYNHHAMPSAGMVPFIQSTVCNIENSCGARVHIERVQQDAQKLQSLVTSLEPVFTDNDVVEALDSMDTGVKLINALGSLNKDGALSKAFNSTNFVIGNYMRNPDDLKKYLVEDLHIMTESTAEALLNSTLNVVELMANLGYLDFRGIVCDVDRLKQYMIFPNGANIGKISLELCHIDNDSIPAITEAVQKQIDVGAIIKSAKLLTTLTGKYELSDALDDIATLADLLLTTSSFSSILQDLPMLLELPNLIRQMPSWFDRLINMQELDTSSLDAIVNFLDPILGKVSPNSEPWNVTKHVVGQIKEMIVAVGDGKNVNWELLLTNGEDLSKLIQSTNETKVIMDYVTAFSNPVIANVTASLMTGNTNITQQELVEMLNVLQPSIERILGKETAYSFMFFVEGIVDAISVILDSISRLNLLDELVSQNSKILDAVEIMIREGPNITNALLEEFLNPHTIQEIFSNISTLNMKATCRKIIQRVMTSSDSSVRIQLEESLCTDSVESVVESISKSLNISMFEAEIQAALKKINQAFNMTETSVIHLSDLVHKVGNITENADRLFSNGNELWRKIEEKLSNPVNALKWSHVNSSEWNMLYEKTSEKLLQGSWPMLMMTIGPMIENSSLWNVIGPWMWTMNTMLQYNVHQMNALKDMSNENTTMGMMLTFAVEYAPELIESGMKMAFTPSSQMITLIVENPDPEVLFCEKHLLHQMMNYSDIPIVEMENKLCQTNWTNFALEMESIYNTLPMMEKISSYLDPSNTEIMNTKFNWSGMVSAIQTLSSVYMDPMSMINTGPMYLLQQLNMTEIMYAIENGMTALQTSPGAMSPTGSEPNVMDSIQQGFLQTAKEMDAVAANSSEWRVFKHYIKLWDSVVKVMSEFFVSTQDGSSVTLEQYLANVSITFKDYIQESMHITPEILRVLKNTTMEPNKVLQRLLILDVSKLCNGTHISDLFGSMALRDYETNLCQLNWTKILNEVMQNNQLIKGLIDEWDLIMHQWHHLPPVDLDWEAVLNRSVELVGMVQKWKPPVTDSGFFGIDLNSLNMTWASYVKYLSTINTLDMQKFGQVLTQMQLLLEKIPMLVATNASDPINEFFKVERYLMHQNYAFMKFITKQLEYFNGSEVINIREYLNSSEANKILDVIENGPEVDSYLIKAMVNLLEKPEKISEVSSELPYICNDTKALELLLHDNSTDLKLVQTRICGLNLNLTVLLDQLYQSIDGLKALSDALTMDMDSSIKMVNISDIISYQNQITSLVTDLIRIPRNVTLGSSNAWLDGESYIEEWQSVFKYIQEKFAPENLTQLSTQTIADLLPLLTSTNQTMQGYELIYMVLGNVMKALDRMNGTTFNIEVFMDNSPHLLQMWHLIQSPGVVEILMTSLNTPKMAELFGMSAETALTHLCSPVNNNFTLFFKKPSDSSVDMTALQQDFCNSNISIIAEELKQIFDIDDVIAMFEGTGTKPLNWTSIQSLYTRVQEKITHWSENPPKIIGITERWMNESYWIQLLSDYVASMENPQNITVQIENALQSIGPLVMQEPFSSYAALLQSLLRIVNENMNFNTTNLTFENLFQRVPVLRDALNSLNMSTDIFKLIAAAPFKHPNAIIDLVNSEDIINAICTSASTFWQDILDWNSLSATPLSFNYCNMTESELFKKLMDDLKATDIVDIVSQMQSNKTRQPDWKDIIQKSYELSRNIQNLINTTGYGLDIGPTLDYLSSLYQTDIIASTNFTQLYSQIHVLMGNTPEWEAIDNFFRAGQILTDFLVGALDKVGVNSGKIDLGLLLRNTTRIKSLLAAVQIDDDLISSFITGVIKTDKYGEFISLLADSNKTKDFLCDENQWMTFFSFPSSVNLTRVVQAVCGISGEELQNELVKSLNIQHVLDLMTPNTTLPKFQVNHFIKSIQRISEEVLAMMNISSVDFSGFDLSRLDKLNSSVIMSNIQKSMDTLPSTIESLVLPLLPSNGTELKTMAAIISGFSMWTKLLNERLTVLSENPLNMSLLFGGSALDPAIEILLTDPRWMEEISKLQVNPDKLLAGLQNSSDSDLCRVIMDSIVDPANATVIPDLRDIICNINRSDLVLESMTLFLTDLQFAKKFEAIVKEAMEQATILNASNLYHEVNELSEILNILFKRNYTKEELDRNFNFSAFSSMLEKIANNWYQELTSMSFTQYIPVIMQSIMSIKNPEIEKAIHSINVLLAEVNSRLEYMKDHVTIDTLVKNSTFLASLLRMTINIDNRTLESGVIDGVNLEKLFTLLTNSSEIESLCSNSKLAGYLTTGNETSRLADDMATFICTKPDLILQKLMNETDLSKVIDKMTDIINGKENSTLSWTDLKKNIETFNSLLDHMMKNPPSIGKDLATFSMNMLFESLQKYFMDPSQLFQFSQAASPFLGTAPVPREIIPFVVAWQEAYGQIEKMFTSDPSSLNNSILAGFFKSITSFNSQANMYAWTPTYYKMVLEEAGKHKPVQDLMCNVTAMQQVLSSHANFSGIFVFEVGQLLCNTSSREWYSKMVQHGYSVWPTINDFVAKIENFFEVQTGSTLVTRISFQWADMSKQIENIVKWFNNPDIDWNDIVQVVFGDAQTTQNEVADLLTRGIKWMKNLGFENSEGFLRTVEVISEINNYLTNQIDILRDIGMDAPLTALLPNNTLVASFFESSVSKDTSAALFGAIVNPEKFLTLILDESKWRDVVCNSTLLMENFNFPPGTNISLVRNDLCTNSTLLAGILSTWNVEAVIKSVTDIVNGNVRQNNTDVWFEIEKISGQFLLNIGYIMNVNITMDGFNDWISPVLKSLQSLQSPSVDNLGSTCDAMLHYVENTEFYKKSMEPVLYGIMNNMALAKQQMELQRAFEDIICDLPTLNVTTIVEKLKRANVTDFIQSLMNINTSTSSGKFSCSKMSEMSLNLFNMWNESVAYSMKQQQNWTQCLTRGFTSPTDFFKGMTKSFGIAGELLKILRDPSLQLILSNPDLVSVLDFMFDVYSQQQKVLLKITDLLLYNTSTIDQIQNLFNSVPELFDSLLGSTISLNAGDLINRTSSEIVDILCDSSKLDQIIHLPVFAPNSTINEISSTLCGPNVKANADLIKEMISLGTLSLAVTSHGLNVSDNTWWTNVGNHVANLFSIAQSYGLLDFAQLNGVDFLNSEKELLKFLQEFVYSNGPEALAESIKVLLSDFKAIDNSTFATSLINDMQIMVDGMTSLKVVRNFIPANVVVRSVVKDPDEFLTFLTVNISLSKEVANAILDGSIYYASLLQYKEKDLPSLVCNATKLDRLIDLPSGSITVNDISNQLCTLNESTIVKMTEAILNNLNIGNLVQNYVTSSLNDFLASFNISNSEMESAISKISNATVKLQDATYIFGNATEELELEFVLTPEALKGASSMSSIQDIACGTKSSSSSSHVSDVTGAASSVGTSSSLTPDQEQEMKSMPGDFCQELYKEIILLDGGSVIWGYLKPLVRGKILFSPDVPATRQIIEKMNASSFAGLADFQRMARSWSKGTKSISDLMADKSTYDTAKRLLQDESVNSIASLLGFSVDIADGFSIVDNMDTSQIGNISMLAEILSNYSDCIETDRFYGYESEEELQEAARKLHITNGFLAGIVFDNITPASRTKRNVGTNLPDHVIYKIRMDIDNVEHTGRLKERYWRPYPEDNFFTQMRYFRGFIQLQDILERAIIELQTGLPVNTSTYLQQFPTQCHIHDSYLNVLSSYLLPVMITIAWLASMAVSAKNLVYDRENGQEEALKAMGMYGFLNWWAWFLSTMAIMVLVSIISIIIMRAGNLYVHSNFFILLLYFVTFCFSCTTLSYMVSAFFTRTTLAMLTVLIVYLLTYIPYVVLVSLETTMEYWQKTLACLFSTTAFGFAAQYLARFEIQMEGIHWYNIRDSPIEDDDFSFSWACLMMLIDGCVYLFIGWYIRNVKPGKYGVSQPLYFPFTTTYWGCGSCSKSSADLYKTEDSTDTLVEEPDDRWIPGISLRGLSKRFGDHKAVKNINCDFYEGHVTVLLGHNGAAKTTTINMISGVLEPSSGSVYVYGKPAAESSGKIGVCNQHNALFEYMTVEEHVDFFANIKSNSSKAKLKLENERLLKDVDLWHVRKERISSLSGGMKRKLCVVLAFAGGSEAVILDEPTSGVDPCGRRAIWNLIQKQKLKGVGRREKVGCTILLSTHFLDEADIIGDRIAVMHDGRVLCSGSAIFLKRNLGSGYHLKFIKEEKCNLAAVLSVIQSYLPGAEMIDNIGSDVTISLPLKSRTMTDLQLCLSDIDKNAQEMGIVNYGIYDTTMEEVFGKVCSIAERRKPGNDQSVESMKTATMFDVPQEDTDKMTMDSRAPITRPDYRKRVSSVSMKLQQFLGLMIKRFHHYRRDWRMFLSVIILPLIFVTSGLGFMLIKPDSSAPERILTPPLYGPSSYTFIKDTLQNTMSTGIMQHFKSKPGLGTTCMSGVDFGPPFQCIKDPDLTFSSLSSGNLGKPNCTCSDHKYTCNDAAKKQTVPQMTLKTTTYLRNLDNKDIEQYLLQTWEMHKLDRYGGWSLESDDSSDMMGRIWFNNKGRHALPSFYNAFSNSILRSTLEKKGISQPENYGITAINHPLMLSGQQLTEETIIQSAADMGIAIVLLVAFTFIPVGFIIYAVNEYRKKEKQLQYISGVGPILYWISSFVWDLVIYCVAVGLAVAIMAIFRHNSYWYRDNLAGVTVLIILYGWATIPLMYSLVKVFKDSTSAYMVLFCGSIFIGISTVMLTFLLEFLSSNVAKEGDSCGVKFFLCFTIEDVKRTFDVVKYVFLIFPQFAFVYGFMDIVKMQVTTDILSRFGEDLYESPFSLNMIGWNFTALAIEGVVFFIITLFLEINCCRQSRVPSDLENDIYTDSEEVNTERKRIQTGYGHTDAIVVSNLSKVYKRGRRPFLAVDRLCFGVPGRECFGLLGVNGAGKTTTFRMLTGDLTPSEGSAYIRGSRIAQSKMNIGQNLGYCPQEDALDRFLTARELLYCYARLRGLSSDNIEAAVNDLISELNMHFADKAIHKYSGGMKRILSVAVALIGGPPVVLLDEPTTGMDPSTKRLVWKCLLSAVKNGQSVILSSHSMEECDAICSRLAIMVNGELKCLGTSQLLKQKYGDGYTVTLYTYGLSTIKHDIIEMFNIHFPGSQCTTHHQEVLQVNIPNRKTSVAQIIRVLEEHKERCNIQHYSVSQTTLFNVFLNFARDQSDGTVPESSDSSSGSDTDSDRYISDPFVNPAYAYMNPSFNDDEKTKFSSPLMFQRPELSTKL